MRTSYSQRSVLAALVLLTRRRARPSPRNRNVGAAATPQFAYPARTWEPSTANITVAVSAINNTVRSLDFFSRQKEAMRSIGLGIPVSWYSEATEEAYDINNRGQVIGSMVVDDTWHGFRWDAKNGTLHD